MSADIKASIIITVKNNGIDLFMTMESLKVSQIGLTYEVIIVDEGSVDGCCDFLLNYKFNRPIRKIKGQAGKSSRNLAASIAEGEYFIFCSPRLYFEDDWMEALLEPLFHGAAEGVSPVFEIEERVPGKRQITYSDGILHSIQNYPWIFEEAELVGSPAQPAELAESNGQTGRTAKLNELPKLPELPELPESTVSTEQSQLPAELSELPELPWLSAECMAVSREIFQVYGGMVDGFKSKELEAAEFSLRLWLLGGRCVLVERVSLTQVHRNNFPYDDSADRWEEDLLMLVQLHFNEQQISRYELMLADACCAASSEASEETISPSREQYALRKIHDDSWFKERFSIPL